VPHPTYSPDLAIADFYLFSVLNQKLQGIDVRDDEELKSEILTFSRAFDQTSGKCHSIAGSKDVSVLPQMQETIIHYSHET
jgi:hypothetical protein